MEQAADICYPDIRKKQRKEVYNMKQIVKEIAAAVVIMAVVIAVQIALSQIFTYRVGEVFTRIVTVSIIFCGGGKIIRQKIAAN